MKFAITSQNLRTITPHAGMTRRFILFEAGQGQQPVRTGELKLPKEMAFHNFHGQGPHPVDGVDVLITAACGDGFIHRLGSRGVQVVQTAEPDPVKAVADYLSGTLAPPGPHEHGLHHGH